VAELDAGDVDVLYRSWCRALEFVNNPPIWSAIELVAGMLRSEGLSANQVENLAASVFWNSIVIAPPFTHPDIAADVRTGKSGLG
jgi:hypothetical protein